MNESQNCKGDCIIINSENIHFMKLRNGTKCMPYMISKGEKLRVNYCPNCGNDVRSIMIEPENKS